MPLLDPVTVFTALVVQGPEVQIGRCREFRSALAGWFGLREAQGTSDAAPVMPPAQGHGLATAPLPPCALSVFLIHV